MHTGRMVDLAQALAVAKSRQDVPAAMKLLHADMLLETPAFDAAARGPAENAKVLTRFFRTSPDYNVVLDELPVFIQFVFKDDLISGERFFFDLSSLCAQSGVSTDAVRRTVFGGNR
ncbi:MAG: hypothetical protein JWQ81_3423 [Amycolatopsis sp.]|jgi:hypothetical protein|uniref:hypothetical protein n=1 Tax=Amycolatopsis sp. TaxID=37632 RepID=UPI00262104DC|nr:hypothetical protein [Amycolatopsis sp.]MCU1682684.1 hypothetical protein [Amycolatopsis sp.]